MFTRRSIRVFVSYKDRVMIRVGFKRISIFERSLVYPIYERSVEIDFRYYKRSYVFFIYQLNMPMYIKDYNMMRIQILTEQ